MNFTPHIAAAACFCPACRAATTPTGAANIANWNHFATTLNQGADIAADMAPCGICGMPDDEASMEVYATRKICRCCQLDIEQATEGEFAQLVADSYYLEAKMLGRGVV